NLSTQTFTRYQHNPDDHGSVRANYISALAQDQMGNLWVGTIHGHLQQFAPAKQTFTDYPLAPCGPHSPIRKIVASPSGALWVLAGGLRQFVPHTGQATCYLPEADGTIRALHSGEGALGPSQILINDMYEAASGHVWLAARGSLY